MILSSTSIRHDILYFCLKNQMSISDFNVKNKNYQEHYIQHEKLMNQNKNKYKTKETKKFAKREFFKRLRFFYMKIVI